MPSHIAAFSTTISSVALTPRGFGVPLLLGHHANFAGLTKKYSGDSAEILAALVADGFVSGSSIHEMARVLLSQESAPRNIVVGRVATGHTQVVTLTPKALAAGSVYSLTIELDNTSTTVSFTADATPTAAEIATGLHNAVNAQSAVAVTSTDNTGSISISPDTAGKTFRLSFTVNGKRGRPEDLDLIDATAAPAGYTDDVDDVLADDESWFHLLSEINSDAIGNLLADKCAVLKKVYWGATTDADATESGTTSDLMSDIVGDSNDYAMCMWDHKYNGYAQAALCGKLASKTVGSYSPANQILRQVFVGDLSSTLYTNLDTKKYTVVRPVSSELSATRGGYVGGQYKNLAATIIIAWFESSLQESIANMFLSADKVPFTLEGLAAVRSACERVVSLAVTNLAFSAGDPKSETDPPPKVIIPELSATTTADRAANLLRGVRITARLAGSIDTIVDGKIAIAF